MTTTEFRVQYPELAHLEGEALWDAMTAAVLVASGDRVPIHVATILPDGTLRFEMDPPAFFLPIAVPQTPLRMMYSIPKGKSPEPIPMVDYMPIQYFRDMDTTNNYYTPQLSDLFWGYELEFQENPGVWVPMKYGVNHEFGINEYIGALAKGWIRTKQLSREQLEQERWVYLATASCGCMHFAYLDVTLMFSESSKAILLSRKGERLFLGSCPSINEYRKIIQATVEAGDLGCSSTAQLEVSATSRVDAAALQQEDASGTASGYSKDPD